VAILTYFYDSIIGLFTGKKATEAMPTGTYTTIIEYGGIAVVIGTLLCCCSSIGIYIAYTYLTYSAPAPPKAAGPQPKGKASKRVKSSRLGGTNDNEGVSMSNLLSAADIEDRLHEIKSSSASSSDEEPAMSMPPKSQAISQRNNMAY